MANIKGLDLTVAKTVPNSNPAKTYKFLECKKYEIHSNTKRAKFWFDGFATETTFDSGEDAIIKNQCFEFWENSESDLPSPFNDFDTYFSDTVLNTVNVEAKRKFFTAIKDNVSGYAGTIKDYA